MARDIERVELLFRRQIALHSAKAPRRQTIQRIDGVPRKKGTIELPEHCSVQPLHGTPARPRIALVPSAGYFNAARLPAAAPAWMFVITRASRKELDELIDTICSVQSSRRAFRPVFILEDPDHIEPMRQYGFTFEFICPDAYMGRSKAEQIEMMKAKWDTKLCLEIKGANDAALRALVLSADQPAETGSSARIHPSVEELRR